MSTTQAYSGLNRPGWLTFAAVVLFSVGFLRIISAIYYFADSSRVANVSAGALGDNLFIWGLWDLLIAVLAISAGSMVFHAEPDFFFGSTQPPPSDTP